MFKGLTAGTKFLDYVVRADCEAGVRFTRRIGLGDAVARIVGQAHERWDGKGLPAGLAGEEIELGARIVALANQAEIYHRTEGRPRRTRCCGGARQAGSTPGGRAFERRADAIFAELDKGSVWDAVLEAEPGPDVTIPERRVDELAEALANVVDLKSPYFLGHSRGVARLAEQAAGARPRRRRVGGVRRAGLFHDLGRVGVSNLVWDKPGSLTAAEWEQVRLHAYYTERILARSPVLAPLAQRRGCTTSARTAAATTAARPPRRSGRRARPGGRRRLPRAHRDTALSRGLRA